MSDVYFSVCIPCYEMSGKGHKYLEHNLNQLVIQDFKNFEVIISDQSVNNKIKLLCEKYKKKLDIKYFLNENGKKQASANTNFAMKKASGQVIKIIFQDDYLYTNKALSNLYNVFSRTNISWCVCASEHSYDGVNVFRSFYPNYNDNIQLGNNTISSPSVIAVRRENYIPFDEKLIYLMDVDLYKRYFDRDGMPFVLNDILVVNRLHDKQVSQLVTKSLIRSELHYIKRKFKNQMNIKSLFIYLKRILKSYF